MPRNTVSPSTEGVRPRMSAMYQGKGKTRPIPIIVDSSDARAIGAAAADSRPLSGVVNMPSGPLATKSVELFGAVVPGSTRVNGAVYNPAVGNDSTI